MGSLKCGQGSGHDDNCDNTLGFAGDYDCCYDTNEGQTNIDDYVMLYNAPTYLQLPLRQWGAGNVYLLVLSKAKR